MTWGAEIDTGRKMPAWLNEREIVAISNHYGQWTREGQQLAAADWRWEHIPAIRLPADHPYYAATERGFEYWPGGDEAPADWDGGPVLTPSGLVGSICGTWKRVARPPYNKDRNIIGYRPREVSQDAWMQHGSDVEIPDEHRLAAAEFVINRVLKAKGCDYAIERTVRDFKKRFMNPKGTPLPPHTTLARQLQFLLSNTDIVRIKQLIDGFREEHRFGFRDTPPGLCITLTGPQGCGKTVVAEWLRDVFAYWQGDGNPPFPTPNGIGDIIRKGQPVVIDVPAEPLRYFHLGADAETLS